MSQPKRLSAFLTEHPEGAYCYYSDYAALVQRNIRDHGDWRSKLNFLENDYKAEIARLTAENERLKAKLFMSEAIAEICSQPPGEGAVTVKASVSTGKTVLADLFQVDELKAENERRTEQLNQSMAMTDSCIENINRLTAENERLRKAGDELYKWAGAENRPPQHVYAAWLAAKEGRNAK